MYLAAIVSTSLIGTSMATITLVSTAGNAYYAFPLSKSLSLWTTYRVLMVARASPDDTVYDCTVDTANGNDWLIYLGSGVPVSENASKFYWPSSNSLLSGFGQFSLTIAVTNLSIPVAGAYVTILSGGSPVVAGYTDSLGIVSFLVNAGSYTLNASCFGSNPVVGTVVSVSAGTSVSVVMTSSVIPSAPSPGLCTVRFIVRKNDGTSPLALATVTCKLGTNVAIDGVILTNVKSTGVTNGLGEVDLILVQGASIIKGSKYYTIEIRDPGDLDSCDPVSSFKAIVPTLSSCHGEDLIP